MISWWLNVQNHQYRKKESGSASHSVVYDSATPWTVARQAPLSGISQEWVAIPLSRGSSQPRDRTWVSCIADIFFTLWASREAHEYRGLTIRLYVNFQLQWVSAPLTTAPPHLFNDQLYKSGETVIGYFIKHNQLLLAFKNCFYLHRFLLKLE